MMPPPTIVLGARGNVGSTVTSLLQSKGFSTHSLVRQRRRQDAAGIAWPDLDADGCPLPPVNTPLWVCTTTDGLGDALLSIPEERRRDCIVLQNGVVAEELRAAGMQGGDGGGGCTRVVLYLRAGVACDSAAWEDGGGRTLVSPTGAHSEHAAMVLPGARVASAEEGEFRRAARDKLAWACSAWLLSSAGGGGNGAPLSLGEVADGELGQELRALAMELAPAAAAAVAAEEGGDGRAAEDAFFRQSSSQEEREACADAVLAYCRSIAGAVPSRELALREWRWRNGAIVAAAAAAAAAEAGLFDPPAAALPLHARWCERAGVRLM